MAVAIAALVIAASGTAIAAPHLFTGDKLIATNSLSGNRLRDHSLTGQQVNLSQLGTVPNTSNASNLAGKGPGAFLSSSVSRHESPVEVGTDQGDGTRYIDEACPQGDVLLNGGPANIAAGSILLESFPTPGSTTSWRARIKPQSGGNNFSVVVLCANQ
jgi:hypothetical protein